MYFAPQRTLLIRETGRPGQARRDINGILRKTAAVCENLRDWKYLFILQQKLG